MNAISLKNSIILLIPGGKEILYGKVPGGSRGVSDRAGISQ